MVWSIELGEVETAMEARCRAGPTYNVPHRRGVPMGVLRPVSRLEPLRPAIGELVLSALTGLQLWRMGGASSGLDDDRPKKSVSSSGLTIAFRSWAASS